jgi:hypothetical protein
MANPHGDPPGHQKHDPAPDPAPPTPAATVVVTAVNEPGAQGIHVSGLTTGDEYCASIVFTDADGGGFNEGFSERPVNGDGTIQFDGTHNGATHVKAWLRPGDPTGGTFWDPAVVVDGVTLEVEFDV